MHPDSHALILDGVAHRFGRRWALRGVSLAVPAGEVLAITGNNGSGKSTLLRIVATALRPTRGTGFVHGLSLAAHAQQVRSLIGLLSTDAGLYGDLTAVENLRFASRMLALPDDALQLQRLLDRVGLGREPQLRAREMSSGMQRRLSFARLLLREPAVLLLDEPYNSLDADGVDLVNALVRETRDRGGAVLLVAHDLSRCAGLADRIVTIHDGLLDEDADAEAPRASAGVAPLRVSRGGLA